MASVFDDKENEINFVKSEQDILVGVVFPNQELSQTRERNNQTIPRTPATRLALPDLIGMVDVQTEEVEVSPDERITWGHNNNISSSSVSPYMAHKRPKRARSSSPLGSSPANLSPHAAFDLKRLSQTLKTPQAEPGSELWDRYGGNSSAQKSASNSKLAYLMYTSSPQSSKQASATRIDDKLRRSITCGAQWPKRRRVTGIDSPAEEDVFTNPSKAGMSNLSRASALLMKVNEGRQASQDTKSSFETIPTPSLHKKSSTGSEAVDVNAPPLEVPVVASEAHDNYPICKEENHDSVIIKDEDSDYGDIDEDDIGSLMIDRGPMNSENSKIDFTTTGCRRSADEAVLDKKGQNDGQKDDDDDDDEFGNMDDIDLEGIAAKYDGAETREASMGRSIQKSDTTQNEASKEVSEDEYGNDLEFADFEAAEAEVTQSRQQPTCTQPPVC